MQRMNSLGCSYGISNFTNFHPLPSPNLDRAEPIARLAVMCSALSILNVAAYWQYVVTGIFLMSALGVPANGAKLRRDWDGFRGGVDCSRTSGLKHMFFKRQRRGRTIAWGAAEPQGTSKENGSALTADGAEGNVAMPNRWLVKTNFRAGLLSRLILRGNVARRRRSPRTES
jgi:hypothetical protein